jgi:hypothetical protein
VKNIIGILIGLNLWIALGGRDILTALILQIHVLGKRLLSKKAHKKTHVHRARFNGRPKLPGWLGKRWCSPELGRAVAFIEGGV